MGRAKQSPLFHHVGLDQLQSIVRRLNDEAQGIEIRKLVTEWAAHGHQLLDLWVNNPDLAKKMSPARYFIQPYGIGGKMMPLPNGAGDGPPDGENAALAMFTSLMLHPQLQVFGGPCKRCSRYYLRRSTRQTVYCSRQCGSASNAAKHTQSRRKKQHQDLIKGAARAIKRRTPGATRKKWKVWVAREAEVTVKWLTRALNKGELTPPIGRSV